MKISGPTTNIKQTNDVLIALKNTIEIAEYCDNVEYNNGILTAQSKKRRNVIYVLTRLEHDKFDVIIKCYDADSYHPMNGVIRTIMTGKELHSDVICILKAWHSEITTPQ